MLVLVLPVLPWHLQVYVISTRLAVLGAALGHWWSVVPSSQEYASGLTDSLERRRYDCCPKSRQAVFCAGETGRLGFDVQDFAQEIRVGCRCRHA